jgi:hypothetical protein
VTGPGTPTEGEVVARDLKRAIRWLALATAVLYAALATLGFLGWRDASAKRRDIRETQIENRSVLCAQKTFYTRQVADTEEFLATPQGMKDFPIEGISRESLLRSLGLQKTLRDSYRALSCKAAAAEVPTATTTTTTP